MTYQPKTEAGRFVLETGMMVAASEPDGGCINWEAIVQDMEEEAAKLERERLRAVVRTQFAALGVGLTETQVPCLTESAVLALMQVLPDSHE